LELMRGLLDIERQMGRDRATAPPKGPRVIDLDLLLYGDEVLQTPELLLPHPAMQEREFVLAPLAEIAPEMRHPVLGETVACMLAEVRS
jgi:2-amino-4-hydroxy-6-hydroxymethyldihydropteridine diphosphokinase